MHTNLDPIIRAALKDFSMLESVSPYTRERELVSWFVSGFLLPLVGSDSVIRSSLQVGIELAVPQHRTPTNARKNPDVCKDVVIWPEPLMVCWDESGEAVKHPLAVIEWKSTNTRNRTADRNKSIGDFLAHDLPWLKKTAEVSKDFVGYGVLVDVTKGRLDLTATRNSGGQTDFRWLELGSAPPILSATHVRKYDKKKLENAGHSKAQESIYKNGRLLSAQVWKPNGERCPNSKVVDGAGQICVYKEDDTKSEQLSYSQGEIVDQRFF